MADQNRGMPDAPKPVPPPPPPDNAAARKGASAVAGQELKNKPSTGELLKNGVQDRAAQVKQGAELAAGRVGELAGRGAHAVQRKAGELAGGAKEAPGRIKDAVQAAPEKIKDAVKAAPGKIKEEVTERPFSAVTTIGLPVAAKALDTTFPSFYTDDVKTMVKGMEPYLKMKAGDGLQRAGEVADYAKGKAAELAEAAKVKLEKIRNDERGGTLP